MARFTKRYSTNRLARRRRRAGGRRRSTSRRNRRSRGMRTPRPGKIGYRL